MKKFIRLTILLHFLLFVNNLFANQILLSNEEKEYLQNNTITYAGDPNWLPYEAFDEQGQYVGIISEHIDIIEKELDIKFKKIITKDWLDTLELSKKRGADIISGDAADVVLAQNYKPIDIYIENPLVVVTRDDHPFISDLNHLKEKKIAFANGAGYSADILKKYPDIDFIISETIHSGLIGVKSGQYDVFIGTLAMSDYQIIKMGIENIKISGDTGITMNLTLFVNKDKPLLYSILNRTMKSIDDIHKHRIISKWRHNILGTVIVDYTLLWQIIIVFLIILSIVVIAYLKLAKLNKIILNEKNKFQNIFNKATDGIFILVNGVLADCNDAIVNILQYETKNDILNLTPSQLSPALQPDGENSLEKSYEMIKIAIQKGSNNFEWVHLRADGSEFWADITLTDISRDDDKIIHVVFRDITEKKILENELDQIHNDLENRVLEEVTKNREKDKLMLHQSRLAQMGEMISMIAHQWRQPLNILSMLNQTVVIKYRRGKLDSDIVDYFSENSDKQIQQMSQTIDDFRDFFKPEKEKIDYCINDVVVHSMDMLNPVFSKYDLLIEYDNTKKLYSNGFPNELGQALVNIINNAKDALVDNDISGKVIMVNLEQKDNKAIITIRDNAGGIPEDIIGKIFDPYFSTKAEKNGTGLGLYMTKLIVEEHLGGEIAVENVDGGALFSIGLNKMKGV